MVLSIAKALLEAQKAEKQQGKSGTPETSAGTTTKIKNRKKIKLPPRKSPAVPSRRSPPHYTGPITVRYSAPPPAPVVRPSHRLFFRGEPQLGWSPEETARILPLRYDHARGSRLDLNNGQGLERELVMGLDFGTSCTKVVIDDRQMQQRYAVPLVNGSGVNAYLLPSRLNNDGDIYTLEDRGIAYTDLKLSLMAAPQSEEICSRVCAYLALVIRSSRAWLFTQHARSLLNAKILWTLALGQPADQVTSHKSKQLFEWLGNVAWALAGSTGPISQTGALQQWRKRDDLFSNDDVEVLAMPEMAAQIHGFVSSHGFDQRGANIYLLVDIGAGTVDASIFHVRKNPTGTVSFSFFTNSVEPYGAANLHRFRVGWWQSELAKYEEGGALVAKLEAIRLPTEYRGRYPDEFGFYVKGVVAQFIGGEKTPDETFFQLVHAQVAGRVMYRAWKEKLLTHTAISGIPLFLCGGGGRHIFYKKLKDDLKHTPNASWMNAKYRELTLPSDLIAPGVTRIDYDRLSVAYGLSRLRPGQMRDAEPIMPLVNLARVTDWGQNYIDK